MSFSDSMMQIMRSPASLPDLESIPGYGAAAVDFDLVLHRINDCVDARWLPGAPKTTPNSSG